MGEAEKNEHQIGKTAIICLIECQLINSKLPNTNTKMDIKKLYF